MPCGPSPARPGEPQGYTGRGIGVAVIDSGIDGAPPRRRVPRRHRAERPSGRLQGRRDRDTGVGGGGRGRARHRRHVRARQPRGRHHRRPGHHGRSVPGRGARRPPDRPRCQRRARDAHHPAELRLDPRQRRRVRDPGHQQLLGPRRARRCRTSTSTPSTSPARRRWRPGWSWCSGPATPARAATCSTTTPATTGWCPSDR